ncbi:MAG: calcium-binding protein, partial [Gammaproteobacteria bacterium]|nr:calcium-binding protein [Gammaproteobacteria bacterium]
TIYGADGGSAILSDNDTLTGSSQNDVIFGDGSGGGGAIKRWTTTPFSEGGEAGGGDDTITAGAGNDIIFGDGFKGGASGDYRGGYGGGGGGAGAEGGDGNSSWSAGGIGASDGTSGKTDGNVVNSDYTTLGLERLSYDYNGHNRSGGAGAGLRGNVSTGKDGNRASFSDDLEQTLYDKILNDVEQGTNSDDRIFTQNQGNGSDTIDAGTGNDYVFAGGGDDSVRGGEGDDTLYGGEGIDTFIYVAGDTGIDTIKDFNFLTGDKIDISGLLDYELNDDLTDFIKVVDDGPARNLQLQLDINGGGDDFLNTKYVINLNTLGTGSTILDDISSSLIVL